MLSRLQLGDQHLSSARLPDLFVDGRCRGSGNGGMPAWRRDWESDETQVALTAACLEASGDSARAAAAPPAGIANGPSSSPARYLTALRATGQPTAVLATVAAHEHELGPTESTLARFDAHWQLGDADQARAAVRGSRRGQLGNIELISRLRSAYVATGSTAEHAYERVLEMADARPSRADVDCLVALDFSFNHVDDIVSQAASPEFVARLQPRGRYTLAAAAYSRRDFAASRRQLATLLGTAQHWDAEKLHARMLLEEGHFGAALDNRAVRSRLRPALDEVEYFARLHLGQYRHAFRSYLARSDANRLRCHVRRRGGLPPDRRSRIPIRDPAGRPRRRDLDVSHLSAAARGQRRTHCRVRPSARHAAPTFVPRRRVRPHRPSAQPTGARLPRGRPATPRNRQPLRPALGGSRGIRHQGRPCRPRSIVDPAHAGRRARTRRIFRPDPRLVERHRFARPTIGVVWRSEFVDPMRSIHFVRPKILPRSLQLDVDIVCLQHDATLPNGRRWSTSSRIASSFLDDLDLRDDFETMAAVTAACAAVVGVGTTTTELCSRRRHPDDLSASQPDGGLAARRRRPGLLAPSDANRRRRRRHDHPPSASSELSSCSDPLESISG